MQKQEHISDDVLLDYAESRLTPSSATRVQKHMETGCARCRHEMEFWLRLLPALEADRAPGAPVAVLQRAFALFEQVERVPARWKRSIASLVFDSRLQAAPAGARDMEGGAFRLLYKSQGAHIDLRCERSPRDWTVAGQVLSVEAHELGWGVTARNRTHAGRTIHTDTDALGEFRLRGLASGEYEVILRDIDREIVLPPIKL